MGPCLPWTLGVHLQGGFCLWGQASECAHGVFVSGGPHAVCVRVMGSVHSREREGVVCARQTCAPHSCR